MIELSLYLLLSPIRYLSSSSISPSDLTLMANCIHLQNTLAQTKEMILVLYTAALDAEEKEIIMNSLLSLSCDAFIQPLVLSVLERDLELDGNIGGKAKRKSEKVKLCMMESLSLPLLQILSNPISAGNHFQDNKPAQKQHQKSMYKVKHVYQTAISVMSVLHSLVEHEEAREEMIRTKHVFVDRLLGSASSSFPDYPNSSNRQSSPRPSPNPSTSPKSTVR